MTSSKKSIYDCTSLVDSKLDLLLSRVNSLYPNTFFVREWSNWFTTKYQLVVHSNANFSRNEFFVGRKLTYQEIEVVLNTILLCNTPAQISIDVREDLVYNCLMNHRESKGRFLAIKHINSLSKQIAQLF